MKKHRWKTIRQILAGYNDQSNLFLTLINKDGLISSANTTIIKNLEISDPRQEPVNFFDLIHPFQLEDFKNTLRKTNEISQANDIELYIKNGLYHPMKWQVCHLSDLPGDSGSYLCVGYKIADDERMVRYNRLLKNNCHLIIEGLNGVIFHDISGELIAANQKAASIFGTTLERLYQLKNIDQLWKNHWVITDENGKPVPYEETPFIKAIKTRQQQTQTLIVRLRSGEDRWILFNSQPLIEEEIDGYFPVVSNIIDITSERQLSSRLKMREALISSFLQQTPDLAWVIDEEATLHFASNAFYRHFGLNEKDCINAKVTDLVPPAVTRAVYDHHIKVFKTGKPLQATEKVKWANGSHSITHIHIFPINNISGKKLVGAQAIYVPDKSKLEKELKDTHERLSNFSRATSDAIWEWDMQSGQIFRNEALMEMIGYQLDNSKGLSWWLRRIHPEDRNRLADKVKEATENMQQSWQDEYRFKCADGSYKHVQDKGFVVYENKLPVKMIGSLHDISSLKKLENELADVRLQRQQEISETVIKVQEKERTRIGHELHDNVNQLLSASKLFFDEIIPANPEQKKLKEKSTEYLLMAIEEIRKLSRELVTPQLKGENLAVTIAALLRDLQLAGKLKISFKHDIRDEQLSAGKKITLFRIVQEQLKNIIKHSRASSAEILLKSEEDHVSLIIKDNGKGFDPQQTRQGIGLSNIHERTQFYSGTTDINASPGKGCVLTVTIPLK
jgi:PAS domain S-box-containing protein